MSDFNLLYVCNGDNARAPLAAACTRELVARNTLGVTWSIASAGTEMVEGSLVRPEAQRAAGALDLDLSSHEPVALDADDCRAPDLILAMSWDQVSHIWSLVPGAWEKVFTIKEFIHWAKRAPARPPILFADRAEAMRDKVVQTHQIRKRARSDHGFWGGIRPQDLNLIEPNGKGDEAWSTLAHAVHALTSDIVTLLHGPEPKLAQPKKTKPPAKAAKNSRARKAPVKAASKPPAKAPAKAKAKARR
jgi:protein-tyrosine-phosphatase